MHVDNAGFLRLLCHANDGPKAMGFGTNINKQYFNQSLTLKDQLEQELGIVP